jgi:hypothetical protein
MAKGAEDCVVGDRSVKDVMRFPDVGGTAAVRVAALAADECPEIFPAASKAATVYE